MEKINTKLKLSNLQRKIVEKREQSHNILANSILEIGTIVKVENMSFKGLQRRSKKTEMSEKTGKFKMCIRDRVIGVHFMNPVPLIPTVEAIRGKKTTDEKMCIRDRYYVINGEKVPAVDNEGWYYTKDIGFIKDENLYLVGRKEK